ncbi:MAG: hypothetical protein FJX35_20185 [Alphaproteobacteria bacterium]|nr:hypothetical protein [Alphaproteobacteria bacterium]
MRTILTAGALAAVVATTSPASSQLLIADHAPHLIKVTTDFTGTEVLLFGAIENDGDVVVVISGPESSVTVRRKERFAGLWINRYQMTFPRAPAFYAVAASRPIEELAPANVLERHQIGVRHLRLQPAEVNAPVAEIGLFRAALVRNKQRAGLYSTEVGKVTFLGNRLFRTSIELPANIPVGSYTVNAYFVRGEQVVSAQATPLAISKIGVGADVYEFAHNQAAWYGLLAIAIAVAAGWLASVAFRKG